MENFGQTVVDCTRALELAPEFVAAYVNRGIAYTGLREYPLALADYSKALELSPQNVYAFFNRGNTYLWMDQYKEAVSDYNQTVVLKPEFVAAYVNRGGGSGRTQTVSGGIGRLHPGNPSEPRLCLRLLQSGHHAPGIE
jgi:tetratricopeptide (TPR) repeat protein